MFFSFFALIELSLLFLSLYILKTIFFFIYTNRIRASRKYVLVTGAANGIGYETVKLLLRRGCNVIATDIDVKSLREKHFGEAARLGVILNEDETSDFTSAKTRQVIDSFKRGMKELRHKEADRGILVPVRMDVGKLEDIQRAKRVILEVLFDASQEQVSGQAPPPQELFGIVNNAGIALNCGFEQLGLVEMSDEELQKLTAVNFWGVVRTTKEFFPLLDRDLKEKKKATPCVVNIASVAGYISPPFFSFYASTKHAVRSYTDSLRAEMFDHRCRVSCVEPGFTSTAILSLPKVNPSSEWSREILQTHKNSEQIFSSCQGVEHVSQAIVYALFRDPCPAHQLVETTWMQKLAYLAGIYLLPAKLIDIAVMGNIRRQLRAQDVQQ